MTDSETPVLLSLAHASRVQGVVDVEGFWNVATKATDIVKDGNRIENLAWRHWARPHRKHSSSSLRTESSAASGSVQTPPECSRTFGCTLKLLMADDGFKDWVAEAKDHRHHHLHSNSHSKSETNIQSQAQLQSPHRPPRIQVPSDEDVTANISGIDQGSPVANLEIRLVEPTPVPSRVGSLGTSMNPGAGYGQGQGHMLHSGNMAQVPPPLDEEDEVESITNPGEPGDISPKKQRAKKGKFFVQASPTKGSVSDSSVGAGPSPTIAPAPQVPGQSSRGKSPAIPPPPAQQNRRSSGSSTGGTKKKRHVSLSTMKGKFMAEKRRAAAAMEAKEAREEDGGWEDEDEDLDEWSDDGSDIASMTGSPEQIPPPAPTPLVRMSKKQREAAAAERARIEAELDAQRKREMFAKQAIFGQPQGLLSQALQRGGSLVDLPAAGGPSGLSMTSASASSATAHKGHLHSTFSQSPMGPNLLRSKSAVAIPVQTGVSVTVQQGSGGSNTSQTNGNSHGNGNASGSGGTRTGSAGLGHPRPRLRPPSAEHLETTDESESDDYLATSTTQHKLDQLLQHKEASKAAREAALLAPAAQPLPVAISPTTDRRAMIMREMSESLRKNLILERQKSSTNLTTHRQSDQPAPPRPSVLGGGFLRPLTRVGNGSTSNLNRTQSSAHISRTQSSANLTTSPTSPAPPMTRSNTSGGGSFDHRADLQRRANDMDTSYRSHGW